jgi:hypothetical protein
MLSVKDIKALVARSIYKKYGNTSNLKAVAKTFLSLGVGWAKVIPTRTFSVFGKEFTLNPGPFTMKEHTIIVMMTAAGSASSYAIDILLAQEVYFDQFFQ